MNNIIILASRILLGAVGLLFLSITFRFIFDTQMAASEVGLNISTLTGFATVRADMTGYFVVCGAILIYASLRKMAQYLWPVLLLIAAAFTGRLITIFVNGYDNASFFPMGIELIIIALIIFAKKNWAKTAT